MMPAWYIKDLITVEIAALEREFFGASQGLSRIRTLAVELADRAEKGENDANLWSARRNIEKLTGAGRGI